MHTRLRHPHQTKLLSLTTTIWYINVAGNHGLRRVAATFVAAPHTHVTPVWRYASRGSFNVLHTVQNTAMTHSHKKNCKRCRCCNSTEAPGKQSKLCLASQHSTDAKHKHQLIISSPVCTQPTRLTPHQHLECAKLHAHYTTQSRPDTVR
jgi:hypothetical protein